MFILSWGDISMALLGAMLCLACLSSPWTLSRAEACVPSSHDDIRRMRLSTLVPDLTLSASLTSRESLDSSHTQHRRPQWIAWFSWDISRLWRVWHRQLPCGGAS